MWDVDASSMVPLPNMVAVFRDSPQFVGSTINTEGGPVYLTSDSMSDAVVVPSPVCRLSYCTGKQTQRNYEDQRERDLLQDLASDYEGYKDFNPPRVQGTCEWFFMDDRFRKWRDSNTSSLLWVSAGPGCGKSVLSRALIDEGQLSTSVTTSTICYFFFKDGYESRMHSTDALCTILHQLFTHDPTGSLIRHALPIHKNHGEKLRQNFSELWRILVIVYEYAVGLSRRGLIHLLS